MTNRDPARRLRRIAERYQAEGYEVTLNPGPGHLPTQLSGIGIDLLAHKSDEYIIVEVASNLTRSKESKKIQRILDVIKAMPHWRVDFAVTTSRDSERGAVALEPYSAETVDARLLQAQDMERQGDTRSAFLLAWSVYEATLSHRLLLRDDFIAEPRSRTTSLPKHIGMDAMIHQLRSVGVVNDRQHAELEQALRVRNALVHGLDIKAPIPTVQWVSGLVRIISESALRQVDLQVFQSGQALLGSLCKLIQDADPTLVSEVLQSLGRTQLQPDALKDAVAFFDAVYRRARGIASAAHCLSSCSERDEPWRSRATYELALVAFGAKDFSRAIELTMSIASWNANPDAVWSATLLRGMCLLARNRVEDTARVISELGSPPMIDIDTKARTAVHQAIVMFALGEQALAEEAIDFVFQSYRVAQMSVAYPALGRELVLAKALLTLLKVSDDSLGTEGISGKGHGARWAASAGLHHLRGLALCAGRSATILRSCSPAKRAIVDLTSGWKTPLTLEGLENRLFAFERLLYNPPSTNQIRRSSVG